MRARPGYRNLATPWISKWPPRSIGPEPMKARAGKPFVK
jgi:hypothetical protein